VPLCQDEIPISLSHKQTGTTHRHESDTSQRALHCTVQDEVSVSLEAREQWQGATLPGAYRVGTWWLCMEGRVIMMHADDV
jgi:hypothetical protein